jgi:hypothetical protein
MGSGSALVQSAMGILRLAATLLSKQTGIPVAVILGVAQTASLALEAMLWLFIRRGGMPSRGAVTGYWALVVIGLVGLAVTPEVGWVFIAAAVPYMAAVGAGVAVNYRIQANKLTTAGAISTAAALVQRWTLPVAVILNLLVAAAMERFGVRCAIAGLAVVAAAYAMLHPFWRGLPKQERGTGRGRVRPLVKENPVAALNNSLLYGTWWALYQVLALLGAGPVVQAVVAGVAATVAAGFVTPLGREADRDRHRFIRVTSIAALGGVLLVTLFRSEWTWTVAGLGVTITEVGSNGVANALKGELGDGPDGIRRALVGFLFRFAGVAVLQSFVTGIWLLLGAGRLGYARTAVAVSLVIPVGALVAITRRTGKRLGILISGALTLTIFPPAATADRTWIHAATARSPRRPGRRKRRGDRRQLDGYFLALSRDEFLSVVGWGFATDLVSPTSGTRAHAGHVHRATGGNAPLIAPGYFPGEERVIISPIRRRPVIGRRRKTGRAAIALSRVSYTMDDLPTSLWGDLAQAPTEMVAEVDPDGASIQYVLTSGDLRGRVKVAACATRRGAHRRRPSTIGRPWW